jgi:hypothetical protein
LIFYVQGPDVLVIIIRDTPGFGNVSGKIVFQGSRDGSRFFAFNTNIHGILGARVVVFDWNHGGGVKLVVHRSVPLDVVRLLQAYSRDGVQEILVEQTVVIERTRAINSQFETGVAFLALVTGSEDANASLMDIVQLETFSGVFDRIVAIFTERTRGSSIKHVVVFLTIWDKVLVPGGCVANGLVTALELTHHVPWTASATPENRRDVTIEVEEEP